MLRTPNLKYNYRSAPQAHFSTCHCRKTHIIPFLSPFFLLGFIQFLSNSTLSTNHHLLGKTQISIFHFLYKVYSFCLDNSWVSFKICHKVDIFIYIFVCIYMCFYMGFCFFFLKDFVFYAYYVL